MGDGKSHVSSGRRYNITKNKKKVQNRKSLDSPHSSTACTMPHPNSQKQSLDISQVHLLICTPNFHLHLTNFENDTSSKNFMIRQTLFTTFSYCRHKTLSNVCHDLPPSYQIMTLFYKPLLHSIYSL